MLGSRQLLKDIVNDVAYLVLVALDRHATLGGTWEGLPKDLNGGICPSPKLPNLVSASPNDDTHELFRYENLQLLAARLHVLAGHFRLLNVCQDGPHCLHNVNSPASYDEEPFWAIS